LNSFKSITKTNQLSRTLKHTDLKTEAVHCRGQGQGQGRKMLSSSCPRGRCQSSSTPSLA